eukprot:1231683-Rhodomonas_salina.1
MDCTLCGFGTYSVSVAAISDSVCQLCPAGLTASRGSSNIFDCQACPENSFAPFRSGNITDCVCNLGYSGPDGGPCVACAAGTYKAVNGSSSCIVCPANTYVEETASNSSSMCNPCADFSVAGPGSGSRDDCLCIDGYFGDSGGPCQPCPGGTFKVGINDLSCTKCPVGTYSEELAADNISTCLSCPSNANSLIGSDSLQDCICNGGYTGVDGGACAACAAGKSKAENGSSACTRCAVGQYAPEASLQCTDCVAGGPCEFCPAGNHKNADGICIACTNGTFSTTVGAEDPSSCQPCPTGTFADGDGATSCILCPRNTFSTVQGAANNATCIPCPDSTESPAGSSNNSDCKCRAGLIGPNGGPCQLCAEGSFNIIAGATACTLCPEGKYQDTKGAGECSECSPWFSYSPPGSISQQMCTRGVVDAPSCMEYLAWCARGSLYPQICEESASPPTAPRVGHTAVAIGDNFVV